MVLNLAYRSQLDSHTPQPGERVGGYVRKRFLGRFHPDIEEIRRTTPVGCWGAPISILDNIDALLDPDYTDEAVGAGSWSCVNGVLKETTTTRAGLASSRASLPASH